MSLSGSVLSGLGSTFLISKGKRSCIGCEAIMRVDRKNVMIGPQHKKSWVSTAIRASTNSKNDANWLDDASQQASEYVKKKGSEVGHLSSQKGQEIQNEIEKAKDFIYGKANEAMDNVAETTKRASDFVTEKGKETKKQTASMTERAKDFIVEKASDVKDTATDMSNKTAKYVGDKAMEAKEAILPPKSDV